MRRMIKPTFVTRVAEEALAAPTDTKYGIAVQNKQDGALYY
jgi:tRNA A37 threonylcarbamoyladenosine synthetase subunit TsaC/SUA5/YrdC